MSAKRYEGKIHAAVWELTLRCNLRCRHCASSAGTARGDELSTAEALKLCKDLKRIGAKAVCLFGGEFMLRRDWEKIGETLRSLGIEVSAATNGYAFDDALGRNLKTLELDGVSVSLDAANPKVHDGIRGKTGAHERALNAISTVDAMGFNGKTIITSVSRTNFDELRAMPELILKHIGARDWMWMINFASCHDETRFDRSNRITRADYLKLADVIRDLRPQFHGRLDITATHDMGYFSWKHAAIQNYTWVGCRAGVDTIGIHSNGGVKGCLILPDVFIEGNVRQRPLPDIWSDPKRFGLVRHFRPEMLEGECAGCAFGHVCKGGCKDIAYTYTGSPYHYPFCLHREEMKLSRKA
jgi:radical SAM protein with 4Fe4S-binding SPASM domain